MNLRTKIVFFSGLLIVFFSVLFELRRETLDIQKGAISIIAGFAIMIYPFIEQYIKGLMGTHGEEHS